MPQDKKDKNLNVPPLRFPGFTDEWKLSKLGDECEIQMCKRILAQQTTPKGEVPFFKIGTIGGQPDAYISYELFNLFKEKYNYPQKGEILISCAGTVGRCVRFDGNPAYFQDSNIVWPRNTQCAYTNDFLFYILSNQNWKHLNTTTIVRIYNDDLRSLKIHYPSIEEQKKITRLLVLIDERIATQNKIIDNLQSLIKGLNDSFHDGIQGTPISFDQIGRSYSGLSGKSGDDFGQGSPFITYLNVYQNNIVNEKQIDLVAIDANESQNTVSYGDVLFTLSSETPEETGIGCVYLGSSGKYYLNSFCFGVTITHPDKVYPPYLAYLVSSSKFRKFVYPLAQGSTRFNLQKSDFMRKQFTLLPIEKQKEIATILDTLNNRLSVECKLNELYKSQKDYLLRKLFI